MAIASLLVLGAGPITIAGLYTPCVVVVSIHLLLVMHKVIHSIQVDKSL